MLTPADAAVVHRDPALPGFGVLLDPDQLVAELQRAVPTVEITAPRIEYFRYSPGRYCRAGYVADGPDGVVRGSCLCGQVEFHVTEPFKAVHNCYCSRCRRARAAAHATNGFTSMEGVRFIRGEERLKSYKLPEAKYFTQVFCEVCGSKLPRIDPDRKLAIIPFGALDDDPGIKAIDHIFVAYKSEWHDITDDLPVFLEGPPASTASEK